MLSVLSLVFGWLGVIVIAASVPMICRSLAQREFEMLIFPAILLGLGTLAFAAMVHLWSAA